MITLDIPGYTTLHLRYAVFDVNGTIACGGSLLNGIQERLPDVRKVLDVFLITANTYGRQQEIDDALEISATIIPSGNEAQAKAALVRDLGAEHVVAIGNGANDVLMLQEAALAIGVLQQEGLCTEALRHTDLLVTDICDALDLLRFPGRLRATLRR